MKVIRIIHMRAPTIIKCFVGKREHEPWIHPDVPGDKGGATVLLEGEPGTDKVTMKVAWCRFTDSYSRKLGVKTATAKDPEVVHLRDLPKTLLEVQDQMLSQVSPYLRHHFSERKVCTRTWHHVVRDFLPLQEKKNG